MVPWGIACRSPPLAPGLTTSIREGGDALGRLAGMPPVTRGSPSSAEGGLGRYMHLLHVDLQDAGRHQETSREHHVKLLLEKFPTRGIRGQALVSWTTVCRPVSQGGLGIHHLQDTNMALVTKWVRAGWCNLRET